MADVVDLEKILKRVIFLKDIAGGYICNGGKYCGCGDCTYRSIELIYHNGHAWSKDRHFLQVRQVWIYEGNVWK